jgi:glycosyltransferase involved in cell wall biosynthesis
VTTPVAVVMPCYNYGRYAAEALRSLALQTMRPTEVLVIDDGSTDDSLDVLRGLASELRDTVPITVVHQSNRGIVRTLNEGVAATSAPYVLFVSPDDRSLPALVEKLATALDRNPSTGYAYPKMRLFGDEEGVYLTFPFSPGRLLFDHNYIPGASMVRRAAFNSVGGFRELAAFEDWDLWLGFLDRGWKGVLVPEVLYEWRQHPTSRSHQSVANRLQLRAAILAGHPRSLLRYSLLAVPVTAWSLWRRLRVRSPILRPASYARASSAWIESPGG